MAAFLTVIFIQCFQKVFLWLKITNDLILLQEEIQFATYFLNNDNNFSEAPCLSENCLLPILFQIMK